MSRIAVLIVAAGKGERTGRTGPKQYEPLGGLPMLRRTADAFHGWPVRVVIGPGQDALYRTAMGENALPPVAGGTRRQDSVRLGLEALVTDAPDFVLIHDAARPLVSRAIIERVIAALEAGAAGAVPMLAVADTLRRQEDGQWVTVPREGLWRAQTPQGFRFADILKAHRDHQAADATDDVAIAGLAGLAVEAVAGEEDNLKVTTEKDFALAERLLGGETRSAMGYDAHRFTEGDHVWLCGVKLPHDHGLEGHSDADAGLHALTDAILGCISAGDIGQHFPPTDDRWKGAPSWKFLDHAHRLVRQKGGAVLHCDVTLICERPKIGPHREAMRARIAEILSLDIDRVSVKATTTEGMGYTGRREGLAAQAVATVSLPSRCEAVGHR
ncbi:MAG TPA: bifunctional 2-C-methyl-D-erythritol 4-phosphate cytidylyltransferase/2-C-methyl-D-erythritol 2,4-cyclodiphosphate synthase [Rhizomicrobium sp.]|nr:bifunctional 2-C-methyl-D-erythritol 4-phosphate cytidylyltransferase/2-C-methyl-D-erythritol 2,4-cyclodiphosphate synthase [Rhizomicrobium sp.]